ALRRAQRARPHLQRALRPDERPRGAAAMRELRHRRHARPPRPGAHHVQGRAAACDERRLRRRAHAVPPGAKPPRRPRPVGQRRDDVVRPDYETLQAIGATYLLSSMGAILARAVRAQGRDDEALELTEAVESAAADDDVDAQVLWRGIRAPILARAGQIAEAEALARAAHERARQTEMPELQGFALTELASALQLAGRIDEARAAMADAIVVYAKKGDVASEGR